MDNDGDKVATELDKDRECRWEGSNADVCGSE
jgi:hypothetical protein